MTGSKNILCASTALTLALGAFAAPSAYAQDNGEAQASSTSGKGIADIIVTANRREESSQTVPVAVTAVTGEQIRELGINSAADLTGKVPSLFISSGGNQRNVEVVVIRGQGQTYLSPVGVVNYFNDVPLIQGGITAIQGAPGTFFDLESMQVLRGPQGTLFGRNTTGGAVLLGPKKPTNEFDGYMQVQYGNYNDLEFEGAINLPVVQDKLAIRASFKKVDRDGYTKDVGPQAYSVDGGYQFNVVCAPPAFGNLGGCNPNSGYAGKDYDDRHMWHARFAVRFTPTDGIEDNLVAYYGKSHDNGSGFVFDGFRGMNGGVFPAGTYGAGDMTVTSLAGAYTALLAGNSGPYVGFFETGNAVAQQILDQQAKLGPRKIAKNQDDFEKTKGWGIVNALSIDLSDTMLVKSITGYQRLKQNYAWDLDGSILPILSQNEPFTTAAASAEAPAWLVGQAGDEVNITDQSLFSQELQLQGSALDKKFQYVLGGFYSKQKPEGLQATGSFNAANRSAAGFYAITTTAKALFAQASLDFGAFAPSLDGLKLTGGIRRTWDKTDGSRYAGNYVLYPTVLHHKLKSAATTWTVGLDYQANRNLLVYGKVTRGYKAGAFNYTSPDINTMSAAPEYVTSYEAGFKSDFELGSMPVRFNANVFRLDYSDIQRAAALNTPNTCLTADPDPRCALLGNQTGLDQGAIIFNAQKARMTGVELELVLQPVEGLRLSGTYSYIDAKYKKFTQDLSGSGFETKVFTCDGIEPLTYGVPQTYDFTCAPFQLTPKNLINLNARYEVPLGGDAGTLVFGANWSWVDKVYTSATRPLAGDPLALMDSYGKLDLSFEWNGIMGSNFDLRVFGTNVTDKTYRTYAYTGLSGSSGFVESLYGEPRMYGASLRYRFGASAD
ncbi:MAG: TonB-dependent receptor [Novosphingobium sp.]|nr:TonB-dependent receptor [Novosphingobium sp.]